MKKGFTLIELMGVVALLALIGLIVFPSILNQMKKIDTNISEANKKLIYSAVDDYVRDDVVNVCLSDGGKLYIKISELKKKGLLSEEVDVKGYETVFVDYVDGKYKYEMLDTKKIDEPYTCEDIVKKYRVFKNGEEVYFNPSKNIGSGQCTDYVEGNSCTRNTSGCLKWYAFNDDELSPTVTLILDHLAIWSDVYPINPESIKMAGWAIQYRLMTSDEVAKITGNKKFNNETATKYDWFYLDSNDQNQTVEDFANSKYSWLFKDCTNYNASTGRKSERYTHGFATGSKSITSNGEYAGVWTVNGWLSSGSKSAALVLDPGATNYPTFDIKPVIEISKEWVK